MKSVGHSLATQLEIMLFRWKCRALHGHVPVNYLSVLLRARPVVCAPAPAPAPAYICILAEKRMPASKGDTTRPKVCVSLI